ncbi:MAG: sulfotransferase [Candidatus Binatia bacterium]
MSRRRSPIGFVEALARRLGRRGAPPPESPFRYVFIVGYARSGSTMLQKVLASIDGFLVTSENADALSGLFFAYQSACTAHREQSTPLPDDPHDPAAGSADRFDPDRYARSLAQAFVDELVQPPARARLIGFKEARYFDRLDVFDEFVGFLQRAFVPSLVVFNKRDPAAVAQSGWWRNYPRAPLIAEIERFDRLAAAYAKTRPADTIIVDYDRYARNATALRPLFAKLGVPFDADAIQTILATPSDD